MAHLKDLVNSVGFGRPFIDSGGAFGLNRLCEDDIPGYSSPPTVCNLAPVASVRGFSLPRDGSPETKNRATLCPLRLGP